MENRTKGIELLEDFISYRCNDGRELYNSVQNYLERKLNGDSFTADDVMQEVLLKSWRFKDKYNPNERLSPWLFTVANNALRDYHRVNRKHFDNASLDELSGNREEGEYEIESSGLRPDEECSRTEEAELLRERINELPEKIRESIELINFQGLTYNKTAELLRIPEGTVKSRVRKGLELLRKDYSLHIKAA